MKYVEFESVWDAIEGTPGDAENMKLRCVLMSALEQHIAHKKLSRAKAAKDFGVTQPRVSDLVNGKINQFGIDSLINMAANAGLKINLSVGQPSNG